MIAPPLNSQTCYATQATPTSWVGTPPTGDWLEVWFGARSNPEIAYRTFKKHNLWYNCTLFNYSHWDCLAYHHLPGKNISLMAWKTNTFIFMHLADTFIQSDLRCIQGKHWSVHAFPGNRTHDLGVASAMLFCL